MAEEIQSLPQVTETTISNGKVTEPNAPKPLYVNDGPTPGNPTTPTGARSITANTAVGNANDNLAHVCDFVSEMQKNINLKKYVKSVANEIRKAIRAVLKALGFADATGQASWFANTLKAAAREADYINKQILQPIVNFERYVVAYIVKLREIVQWILSLPVKFLAILQDCLARLLKLIGSVFSDIGAGLSEGFTEGPSDYNQTIQEAKKLVTAAQETVNSSITVLAGAANIAGEATFGLLIPTSQAELNAANTIIQSYESNTPLSQNKSAI